MVDGRARAVAQVPCALWQGIDALDESLAALPGWARQEALHAVTMTGELCEAFTDRREGVVALSQWAWARLSGPVAVYAGPLGFIDPRKAEAAAYEIASANWHATAQLVGRHVRDALVIDIGSTTSDLIPVVAGRPRTQGYSDAERLRTGELVYAGAVRTPLMALGPEIAFRGQATGLTAEHFATTADVYRRLGLLPEAADQQEAADGRGKSLTETETRLARMIGCDRSDATSEEWRELAAAFAEAQLDRLARASLRVTGNAGLPGHAPIVGCGVGRFIARALAQRLERPVHDLAEVLEAGTDDAWVSYCAPAVAVALLASSG